MFYRLMVMIIFIEKQEEIDQFLKNVNKFGNVSAAKVNWERSEVLAVGGWFSGLSPRKNEIEKK